MKFTQSLGAQLNVNPFAVIASNIAYMTSKNPIRSKSSDITPGIANLENSEGGVNFSWGGYFGFSAEEGYFLENIPLKKREKSEVRFLAYLSLNLTKLRLIKLN